MNVLFVASEMAPFAKTGGLADVMAALPAYLHRAEPQRRGAQPLAADRDVALGLLQKLPLHEDERHRDRHDDDDHHGHELDAGG